MASTDSRKSHVVGISSSGAEVGGVESGCDGVNVNQSMSEGSHKGV